MGVEVSEEIKLSLMDMNNLGCARGPLYKTLVPFMTKICDFRN